MSKTTKRYEDEPDAPEAEVKTGPKAAPKEVENEASHLEPYPTGNPPDPMEVYDAAHPERSVDWSTTPPQAPPPEGATRAKKER